MSSKRILVVDDETSRRQLNAFGLRCAGFGVDEANDSASALAQIARHCPHLVLIVAAMLDFGVQDFVRALRGDSCTRDLPVLALVEHEGEFGATTALEWGIDDYVQEPIPPEGFVQRVRAVLDHRARSASMKGSLAALSVDDERGVVRKGAHAVALGPTERRVLEFFLAHPEQLIPRDLLLFRIWGGGASLQSRVVDVSVCRLRRVLEQLGCEALLQTVNRQGYRMSARANEPEARESSPTPRHDNVTFASSNARRA